MEQKILELFAFNEKLKFNEIEKLITQRSNKISYHLKKLLEKGILEKENGSYKLSETAEYLIPYLSSKKSPLVVVLVVIGNKKECFLYKRKKRPFKNKLSLPGGRLLANETIQEAVTRIMEKYNVNAKFKKIKAINHEFVSKNKKPIHSFILISVIATTKDKINLIQIKTNKKEIISSDYKIIISKNKQLKIDKFYTKSN